MSETTSKHRVLTRLWTKTYTAKGLLVARSVEIFSLMANSVSLIQRHRLYTRVIMRSIAMSLWSVSRRCRIKRERELARRHLSVRIRDRRARRR